MAIFSGNIAVTNATGTVRAFSMILPTSSWDVRLVKCSLKLKSFFNDFSLKIAQDFEFFYKYIQQIMNAFSFVQWNKYFHSVQDEMYHLTPLHLVERNISSFTSWKYLYHCTHKYSLHTKVRATVLLTCTACGASRQCLTHCRVIGHNCPSGSIVCDYKNLWMNWPCLLYPFGTSVWRIKRKVAFRLMKVNS